MDICQQAERIQDEMILIRRHLHQHPELSGQEFLTSQLIGQKLAELGIEVQQWETKSGVVGLLRGEFPGPTLAIRADIDALKIQEATGFSFASVNDGIAHSCGHDIHATV
ncbi:MAG: M20/M25/M40 family metallo-hydrolase, partial [Sporomusa sp.]